MDDYDSMTDRELLDAAWHALGDAFEGGEYAHAALNGLPMSYAGGREADEGIAVRRAIWRRLHPKREEG